MPHDGLIERALTELCAGRPIGLPTETVYGLAAPALDDTAVRRVFELKGRPSNNPLIVHLPDAEMAGTVVAEWTADAALLADRFWPGPLTLVLERGASVPGSVTAGGDTVAVRVPDHPIAIAVLEAFDAPLVAPSANRSGRVSPTTSDHVRAEFGDAVYVLEGGPCRAGLESTVLDLSQDPPAILRRGVIGAEELSQAIGKEIRADGERTEIARSPGLVGPHYRPSTQMVLVEVPGPDAMLVVSHRAEDWRESADWLEMPKDPARYAARLYAAMREADAQANKLAAGRIDWVRPEIPLGSSPQNRAIWRAVLERLSRAADDDPGL